ncbi:hypothetical protein DL769_011448 [Monosporascus sp. CRB-8-3]|nr:hypothetical protein DL769_011448 [Monosporascus sp. CRB-8-3]
MSTVTESFSSIRSANVVSGAGDSRYPKRARLDGMAGESGNREIPDSDVEQSSVSGPEEIHHDDADWSDFDYSTVAESDESEDSAAPDGQPRLSSHSENLRHKTFHDVFRFAADEDYATLVGIVNRADGGDGLF